MPGFLPAQHIRGQTAQFRIDNRQELGSCPSILVLNRAQHARELTHTAQDRGSPAQKELPALFQNNSDMSPVSLGVNQVGRYTYPISPLIITFALGLSFAVSRSAQKPVNPKRKVFSMRKVMSLPWLRAPQSDQPRQRPTLVRTRPFTTPSDPPVHNGPARVSPTRPTTAVASPEGELA